jgi:hypothetical protein
MKEYLVADPSRITVSTSNELNIKDAHKGAHRDTHGGAPREA